MHSSQIYYGIKLYMFRTVPFSIIRSFSLYTQQWYMSYRFADSLRAGSERNWFRSDIIECGTTRPRSVFHSQFTVYCPGII
jgi:hypothetical protein